MFNVITTARPHCGSMGYAMKYIRTAVSNISNDMSESESKAYLISEIDKFLLEKITQASATIVKEITNVIRNNEVILTFGRSQVVEMGLIEAKKNGKNFKVIVVDGRPKLEGKSMTKELASHGIQVTYCLINAVSYVMSDVNTVIMGASSMMSNGAVVSRIGSAVVASMAKWYNKPVLFCCETYKFTEKVSLDSICTNELGDPDMLVNTG